MTSGFERIFAPQAFATSINADLVAHADFNADGFSDVVAATSGRKPISVLYGKAGGNFEHPQVFQDRDIVSAIAVGDVDSDGFPDIITTNYIFSVVSIYRGSANDTFTFYGEYSVAENPIALLCNDFDGDGFLDLITASEVGLISFFSNNGDGTFADVVDTSLSGRPLIVESADFDKNNRPDLAIVLQDTSNLSDFRLQVLQNRSAGEFDLVFEQSIADSPVVIEVGDFNSDDRPDIVTTKNSREETERELISFYAGRGDGTFDQPFGTSILPSQYGNGSISRLATGDVDADGSTDLIAIFSGTINQGTNSILRNSAMVLKGSGDGRFEQIADSFVGNFPQNLLVIDIGDDGTLDVIVTDGRNETLTSIPGRRDGTLGSSAEHYFEYSLSAIEAGDFDRDGLVDLLVADANGNRLAIMKRLANGKYEPNGEVQTEISSRWLSVADFNSDSRPDFVIVDAAGSGEVWMGDGRGGFSRFGEFTVAGTLPDFLAVGDANGDGVPDLVFSKSGEGALSILFSDGRGGFHVQAEVPVGSSPQFVAFVEIDGNNLLDLVVTHGDDSDSKLSILLNRGNGAYQNLSNEQLNKSPSFVTAGDYDQNGTADLFLYLPGSEQVTILTGRGDGTFGATITADLGMPISRLRAADFDGDGNLDILATSPFEGVVSILKGDAKGTFSAPHHYSVLREAYDEVITDLNGDGRLDVALAGDWLQILDNLSLNSSDGPNLIVDSVKATPLSAGVGKNLKVEYVLRNAGDNGVSSGWADTVYLSKNEQFDSADFQLSTAVQNTGLAAGDTAKTFLDAAIPAISGFVPGEWFIIVRTDVRNNIAESLEADNVAAAPIVLDQQITALDLEMPETFELETGESRYFSFQFEAGQGLFVQLDGLPRDGVVGMYVKRDGIPDIKRFDRSAEKAFASEQIVNLPRFENAGTLYILVKASSLTSLPLRAHITVKEQKFSIRTTQFGTGANGGNLTIRALGYGLDDSIKTSLVVPGQLDRIPISTFRQSDTELFLTFDLRGLAAGKYDLIFTNLEGQSITVLQSLTVVEAGSKKESGFSARVILPSRVRRGTITTGHLEFRNDSLNDIPVPLLTLSASNGKISLDRDASEYRDVVRVLASENGGPVQVLRPGQPFVRKFYTKTHINEPALEMQVGVSILELGRPGWDAPTNWVAALGMLNSDVVGGAASIDALENTLGRTQGEYVERLRNLSEAYGKFGNRIYDADYLEKLLLMAADSSPDGARLSRNGSFGNGQRAGSHPTNAFAWNWFDQSFSKTPLVQADLVPGAYTVVIIHGWKNNLTDTWVPVMAKVLQDRVGNQALLNIVGVDWGDVAQHDPYLPFYSAEGVPGVARTVAKQLKSAGLSPQRMHIIGHSHGAHVAGMIGEEFQRMKIGTLDRLTVLDPSQELSHWNAMGNKDGRGWGADQESASFIDSYKSSPTLGGERAWGHDNFLLVKEGQHWADDLPLIGEGNDHGYAQLWYLQTIVDGGGQHQLGYRWGPESWRILTKDVPGYDSPKRPWLGLIRGSDNGDHVVELLSQAVGVTTIDDWNYPGEWDQGIRGISSDSAQVNKIIEDMAKSVDFSIQVASVTNGRDLKAAERISLKVLLANNADNRSIPLWLRQLAQLNLFAKFYLSFDESIGNDIELKVGEGSIIPFLGALGDDAEESQKELSVEVTLPEKSLIEGNWGRELPGEYYLIIDAASKNPHELNAKDNISFLPITIQGEELGANPGGEYGALDADRNGVESITLNGSMSGPQKRIVSYLWTSNGVPIGTTSVLSSNFSVGTHQVSLTIVDEDGKSDTADTTVRIRPKREEPFPPPIEPLANSRILGAWDPNDILGPVGFGQLNYVAPRGVLPYTIRFENDSQKATAPAALVTINHKLDSDLDWTSFRFNDIGFGDLVINVPEELANFETRIDLTESKRFYVDIQAKLELTTGNVRWEFMAVDPTTGDLPEDPFAGFLPPNKVSPEGQGFVSFTVWPKSNLQTGSRIDATASIVFDVN